MAGWLAQDTQRWVNDLWGEDLTLTSVRAAGDVSADVTGAVYRLTLKELANSNGAYRSGDVRVTLASDAVEWEPKPGDRVAWKGAAYTVLDVTGSDLTRHWVMTGRRADIAPEVKQLGTLSRPTNARDASGYPTYATYTVVAEDIPCRVQPESDTAADVMERRTMPRRYTAFLETAVVAKAKDRFVCAGVTYTVVGFNDPEKLGELMSLTLEKIE